MSARRDALLPALAEAVMEHGLDLPLRPLAAAAGTSDRMLIYHFGSRDGLIDAVLAHLGAGVSARLAAAHPGGPAPSLHALAGMMLDVLRDPALARTVRVWFELLSDPARRPMAGALLDGYHAWLTAALPPDAPEGAADAVLAFAEGAVVLDAAGRPDRVDLARAILFPDGPTG